MREKNIEVKLRNEIKKLGGLALKFVSPGHAGVADRIVLMPGGKIWFVELKSKGQKLSPLQNIFLKQMLDLKFRYIVIDSDDMLRAFLTLLRTQKLIDGL